MGKPSLFSQHGTEAMMAIAFTCRPSVGVVVVVVNNCGSFETIIATGLKSYRHFKGGILHYHNAFQKILWNRWILFKTWPFSYILKELFGSF